MTITQFAKNTLPAALAVVLSVTAASGAVAGELRAGAGKASITPAAGDLPWTARGEKAFVGVHDPVYARALVLDDGGRKVVLVTIEVTAVPVPAELVKSVAEAAGVPQANVMVVASHTHNMPLVFYHGGEPDPVQTRWIARVRQASVEATRDAVSHLQPARIASARGEAWVNANNGEQAGYTNWYDAKGPSDKTLDLLRVEDRKGQAIALVVNYASHAEVMFRSATKNGGYEVSGDLPGVTAQLLEANAKGAPVVLFTPAAEADQLPLLKSLQPAGVLPESDQGAAGWALLDALSRRLASAVIDTQGALSPPVSNLTLAAGTSSVSCPGQRIRRDRTTGQITTEAGPPVAIPLAALRIGDVTLAGVGGDIGTDIGRQIKAASPRSKTTVVSMIAGEVGYILPDAAYAKPGHGVMGSSLKPGCAEKAIVAGLGKLSAGLK